MLDSLVVASARCTLAVRLAAAAFLLVAAALATPAWACLAPCDGTVDSTWADNGTATVVEHARGYGTVLPLADGKIVMVGTCAYDTVGVDYMSVCVTRLRQDGSVDASFGVAGHAIIRQMPGALHGLESGLIGSALFLVGNSQQQDFAFSPAAIAPDGHIVIGAENADHRWVVRLRGDGKVIDTVLADPLPQSKLRALLVQRDGKVVLVGHGHPLDPDYVTVARFLPDLSSHDTSFGLGGASWLDPASGISEVWFHDLAETIDGALVLAGDAFATTPADDYFEGYVARLTSSGSYDYAFDGNGRWHDFYSHGYSRVVANRHKQIFVAGRAEDAVPGHEHIRLMQLRANGTTLAQGDFSAPICEQGDEFVAGLGLQPDGKLLLTAVCLGDATPFWWVELARFNDAASLDSTFGEFGFTVFSPANLGNLPTPYSIAVGDGGILLGWQSYDMSGTLKDPHHVTRFKLDEIFPSSFED